jgi:beta-N-acetylhexosaminidase
LLNEIKPGGVCLFSRNIRDARQTRQFTDRLRAALDLEPIISLDQEGGLVDRLRRVIEPMPAASEFRNTRDVEHLASLIAETVRMLGFNMDLAPVVDVAGGERDCLNNGLASRTYGTGPSQTTEYAGVFLNSLRSHGCLGCIKHFPGLGAARVDSHDELPVVDLFESELRSVDLEPYRSLLDQTEVDAVMVGHAAYPALSLQELDADGRLLPSSLSYGIVTDLLRGELGYDGLVISDDLEMGAIVRNYGIGDACRMAILAGADMLAICASPDAIREGYSAVLEAVKSGVISEERLNASLDRIEKVRSRLSPPLPLDESRLEEISVSIRELKAHLEQNKSEVFS